ncbi:DNA-cytosine methyltransferase [hydrothermal vent metagenome]|uniref:DNA (cytosine-5-)-methyltransferase n=1 Tax=hydrothermal vent metagenome TaxID=652676 RepID=A0A3B0VJ76_9ZZZZ
MPQENYKFSTLREKAGLSISELAEKTGRSKRTIYRWENGESRPDKMAKKMLVQICESAEITYQTSNATFDFIDLFAGIGGMRRGFESAGGRCVFTSEWNKFSRQAYTANFECDHDIAGDITQVEAEDIPNHDVLLAGFPCQPFSIAGVSKKNSLGRAHGFEDETQGTLFFDIVRILKFHKPKAFLLENVKNLRSHDKGKTYKVITKKLCGLGYNISMRVINAKGYVPQNRERIFIVGFLEDNGFDLNMLNVPNANNGPKLKSILHSEDGMEEEEPPYTEGDLAEIGEKYTLSPKLWSYLQAYAQKHKAKGNGFGYGLVGSDDTARTLSARYFKDGSEILIRQENNRPRRLTPRECARLMGFDQPSKPKFEIPVSDTQAYKQFGNAVVVPVVEAIAQFMVPYLENASIVQEGQLKLPLYV